MVNPIPAAQVSRVKDITEVEVKPEVKVEIQNLSFFYGRNQVLRNVSLDVPAYQVTAMIGPSGWGKTTLLRCLNRMHDLYPGNRYEVSVRLHPG